MREFFVNLFRDDTFGPDIRLYNIWHILFLVIVLGSIIATCIFTYKKSEETKSKILDVLAIIIICLYLGDFFVHPLMNNENSLIVDKLPFHLCTSASILICITRLFPDKFKRLYQVVPVLGMIGAMLYIFVPTGVDGCKLFCYRSLQTLAYHALLFSYGIFSIVYKSVNMEWKNMITVSILVVVQIIISLIANNVYSTADHHYDWYFTTGSFGIPSKLMPFAIFVCFVGQFAVVYALVLLIRYLINKRSKEEFNA